MRIVITCSLDEEQELGFIYKFLPSYIYRLYSQALDEKKLKQIDEQFGIDSKKALNMAFKHLLITKLGNNRYTIGFNKNIVVGDNKLGLLLPMIANGNLQVKGYGLVRSILVYVYKNINNIYEEYKRGNSLL